jgi:hypothetical protein
MSQTEKAPKLNLRDWEVHEKESTLTANELIGTLWEALLRFCNANLLLNGIDRSWSNLKEYLVLQGFDYFRCDVGMGLAGRYGFVVRQACSALSPADQYLLRAFDLPAHFLVYLSLSVAGLIVA